MNTFILFSKIFRSSIILFFIFFTVHSLGISSYLLGKDNICSPEQNSFDDKCENNCFCDRDQLIHSKDYRNFFLNNLEIKNHQIIFTKSKLIEQKANSPPII